MVLFFIPRPVLKTEGDLKTGRVCRVRVVRPSHYHCNWKKAYVSESIAHRILELKLRSLCKNSISKMLLDFRLAYYANWLID